MKRPDSGFTLIELVVGIVVMAIMLTYMSTVFFSNPGRSVEPILQIRAAEFGQSLMEEILSKKFDDATPLGGIPACSASTTLCTLVVNLGEDAAESRVNFNDVDDYDFYCDADGVDLVTALGENPDEFDNFKMSICVGYDGDYNGTINEGGSSDQLAKLITVLIFAPQAGGSTQSIKFTAYRGNY